MKNELNLLIIVGRPVIDRSVRQAFSLFSLLQLLHSVQRTARLEPLDLAFVHCVVQADLFAAVIRVLDYAAHRLAWCQLLQANQRHFIIRSDFVIVRRIAER